MVSVMITNFQDLSINVKEKDQLKDFVEHWEDIQGLFVNAVEMEIQEMEIWQIALILKIRRIKMDLLLHFKVNEGDEK